MALLYALQILLINQNEGCASINAHFNQKNTKWKKNK
jgi:hypothetical protein